MSALNIALHNAAQSCLDVLDEVEKGHYEGIYHHHGPKAFRYDVEIFKTSKSGKFKTRPYINTLLDNKSEKNIKLEYGDHTSHEIMQKLRLVQSVITKIETMEKQWGHLLSLLLNPDLIARDLWPCFRLTLKDGEFFLTIALKKGSNKKVADPIGHQTKMPYYLTKNTTPLKLRDKGHYILQALNIISTHARAEGEDIYHFFFYEKGDDYSYNKNTFNDQNMHTICAQNEDMAYAWMGATQNHALLLGHIKCEIMKSVSYQPCPNKPEPLTSWPVFPNFLSKEPVF